MYKKQQIGVQFFTLAIAFSIMACMGSIQVMQTPQPTSPTNLPQPTSPIKPPPSTETAIPIAPNIPEATTPTVVSTSEQPVNGQVNILEMNSFKDEGDYWYFYGLVRNDSERTINDVQIEIKLFDSTGAEIYAYTTYSMMSYLEPGETSPFSDFTTDPFADGKTMQATVVGNNSTEAIKRAILEYRRTSLWVDAYNDVYLAGEVFNGNKDPVEINSISGTLMDSNGKLVTASYAYPFLSYIEPDATSPFVMMFDAPVGQAATLDRYTLYSDAMITNPTSTYDISLSEKHKSYQDTNGNAHLVSAMTNNTSEPMHIYLVAGIYDKDGNCVDVNSVYFPVPLNPGATFPYDFSTWGALDYVPGAYEAGTQFKIYIDWMSTYEASSPAFTLTTKDDTSAFDGSVGIFKGTVVNDSGQDLITVIVVATIYDKASGELIATNYSYVTESLTNNASGAYEIYVYPPHDIDPATVRFEITALGQ